MSRASYDAIVVGAGPNGLAAAIVLGVVVAALSALVMPGRYGAGAVTLGTPSGSVTVDTASVEAAARSMEQAAKAMEQAAQQQPGNAAAIGQAAQAMAQAAGTGGTVAADALKAALPNEAAGLPRPVGPPHVLWSPGVDVRIGRPRPLGA